MVLSMTSFARREQDTDLGHLRWELRSVNHRFLDINLRLPDELRQLELKVRERIGERVRRGKVDCTLRWQFDTAEVRDFAIDHGMVLRLSRAAEEVGAYLPASAPIDILDVLRWPGVIEVEEPDLEPLYSQVLTLLDEALEDLLEQRGREGGRLKALIEQRCQTVAEIVAGVRGCLPEVRARLRRRLEERLSDLSQQLEPGRLEQEIVIFAQKMDVDEELDRLDSHVDEVRRTLALNEPVGRRLDFLMQELNREANTLSSKAADAEVTRASVELKVLIEQMREQVQNIE